MRRKYCLKKLLDLHDNRRACGRPLVYKGLCSQTEQWLQLSDDCEDLSESAIRQGHYGRARPCLEHIFQMSRTGSLLDAYFYLLASNENVAQGRKVLLKLGMNAERSTSSSSDLFSSGFSSVNVHTSRRASNGIFNDQQRSVRETCTGYSSNHRQASHRYRLFALRSTWSKWSDEILRNSFGVTEPVINLSSFRFRQNSNRPYPLLSMW